MYFLFLQFIEMVNCGGDTVTEMTGRILKKLMTNEVATEYSLWGLKNNQKFATSKCWPVLISKSYSYDVILALRTSMCSAQ